MPKFTPEEKQLLAPYVTSTEENVFAIRNLPGLIGAVYARYSRAPGGFRETLLKEFIREGQIDATRAQDLIERVLIAYGDDSVGELEGAHVSFEEISMLATKELEDRRIGGSPIEQSTRYVFYDQQDTAGNYRYFTPPEIAQSSHGALYKETMDFLFDTYCKLIEPMKAYYSGLKSIDEAEYDVNGDGVKERLADLSDEKLQKAFRITYNADIRTKACDSLRAILPLSTRTNVGIFGNGRFFQHTISHCYTSDIPEVQEIGKSAHQALEEIIPRYVKRAQPSPYQRENRQRMKQLAGKIFSGIQIHDEQEIVLLDRGEAQVASELRSGEISAERLTELLQTEHDVTTISVMLYPYLAHPLRQIRNVVRSLSEEERGEIIKTYIGKRMSRRDRPGRAFEVGYPYTFDLITDFGTYKDLQRHRMTSQVRQQFTPLLGIDVPEDLVCAGFEADIIACSDKATELFLKLQGDFPEAASYATLHGSRVRWILGMNDREAMHLIELRTTPQGHPSYRRVGKLLHRAITERSEWRGAAMKFVDYGDYFWSRGDAEAKQRVKESALESSASED